MTVPWVIVTVAVVSLLSAAWWFGGRRLWRAVWRTPVKEFDLLHGLAPGAAARVMTAVDQGERLDDPRLRRVAVELASLHLEPNRNSPWRLRVMTGSFVVALAGVGVLMAVQIARSEYDFLLALFLAANALISVGNALFHFHRRRRILERAVELNADGPEGGHPIG